MTFQPVIPSGGLAGWRFLDRTASTQQAAFSKSRPVQTATDYFRSNISKVKNVDDLMKDRRLLTVALGAFGLDADINNTFFIRKILSEGTIDQKSFSNRLADNRYTDLAAAFGFDDLNGPRTLVTDFANTVISRFETRQFEKAVGGQNNDFRLALNVRTGINDILDRSKSENARWFAIMGNAPLRKVFEKALGLPASLAAIDIDKQRDIFRDRSRAVLGTDKVGDLAEPARRDKLIRLFVVQSDQASQRSVSPNASALLILQSAPQTFRRF